MNAGSLATVIMEGQFQDESIKMSTVERDVQHRFSAIDAAEPPPLPASPPRTAGLSSDTGEASCLRLWKRVRCLDARFWRAQPCAGSAADGACRLLLEAMASRTLPYSRIAFEAERSLEQGVRDTTPLALMLLAAFALDRFGPETAVVRLGQAAMELAARDHGPCEATVRALHAALILPYTSAPDSPMAPISDMRAVGAAFVAGVPLPELVSQLEVLQRVIALDGSACPEAPGVAMRLVFLKQLLCQQPASPVAKAEPDSAQNADFGYWLARLQLAWHAGDKDGAVHARQRAEALMNPLTPTMDRLLMHLFAVLTLASERSAPACLAPHLEALQCWAAACANACGKRQAGAELSAFGCLETAAAAATSRGQHWIAALAWEQAATLAQETGLTSAIRHYRQQALASHDSWGAAGRIAGLRRAWRNAEDAFAQPSGTAGALCLSIAHEVNQPLAAISLHAAAARKWLRRDEPNVERALASLTLISSAGRHAGDIVRSMQRLTSGQRSELHDVCVDRIIGDAVEMLRQPLRRHAIRVDLALGLADCIIRANRVQLQQVVTNLVMNAIEALAAGAAVVRRIHVESRRDGDHIEVAVTDNGPGVLDVDRERIFISSFSTKPNNTGIGLSISLSIIHAHGGRIAYEPRQPHGACFKISLPIGQSAA
jgi:signal transduction histidine kinase